MDDRPTCRICLDNTAEELISPCAGCRGSSAFVHFSCIAVFYRSRACWWNLACPTCKRPYEGRAAVHLGHIGLEQVELEHGPEHGDVAVVLVNLGNAYGGLGDDVRRRDLLQRALSIQEREWGPEHRAVAATLTSLGNAYGDLGDAGRQRDLLERALSIQEREYGPDHREVGSTLTNLGNAYGDLGDATWKRDLLERALVIAEREYGPNHREVAVVLMNLGNSYGDLGDAGRKRDLLERVLAIEEREYGLDHREVARTLVNLGNTYGDLSDAARKKELLERALAVFEQAYGPEHGEVAITLTNLGNAHGDLGDVPRQRALLVRALVVFERRYGRSHPHYAMALTSLAVAHAALSEHILAAAASAEALKLAREALPSPNVIVGDMSLFAALVHCAAALADSHAYPQLEVSLDSASGLWADGTAELRATVGPKAARAKVSTFAAHSASFWRTAGRGDVAAWLLAQDLFDANALQDELRDTLRLTSEAQVQHSARTWD